MPNSAFNSGRIILSMNDNCTVYIIKKMYEHFNSGRVIISMNDHCTVYKIKRMYSSVRKVLIEQDFTNLYHLIVFIKIK